MGAVTDSVACAVKLLVEEEFEPEKFFRLSKSQQREAILKDGPGVRSMFEV